MPDKESIMKSKLILTGLSLSIFVALPGLADARGGGDHAGGGFGGGFRGDRTMLAPQFPFVIGTQILLMAASGPPKADVQSTCDASEKELGDIFGGNVRTTIDQCVNQENAAFERIKKDWAKYPADAKQLCVQPEGYSPSYVEWLTCLEMNQQVRQIRAEGAEAAQARAVQRSRTRKVCPSAEFQPDGSIASVTTNC
jgi:hypothetical protein